MAPSMRVNGKTICAMAPVTSRVLMVTHIKANGCLTDLMERVRRSARKIQKQLQIGSMELVMASVLTLTRVDLKNRWCLVRTWLSGTKLSKSIA